MQDLGVMDLPLKVVDLTSEQKDPPRNEPPDHKIVRGKKPELDRVFRRSPSTIDGIVIHQTSCPFGVSKQQLKQAGGDAKLAKHRRALNVAAHMTAFDTGYAVLAHPLDWYVYHGNGLNARSLGLEVEGLFPGVLKPGATLQMSDSLLQAARDGLAYLTRRGRERGMPIRWIWAHRQSNLIKENDPGEEIWKRVVLEYAVPTLGLVPQLDFISGGRSIPKAWSEPKIFYQYGMKL